MQLLSSSIYPARLWTVKEHIQNFSGNNISSLKLFLVSRQSFQWHVVRFLVNRNKMFMYMLLISIYIFIQFRISYKMIPRRCYGYTKGSLKINFHREYNTLSTTGNQDPESQCIFPQNLDINSNPDHHKCDSTTSTLKVKCQGKQISY